jgi:zinc and cadmium transporter
MSRPKVAWLIADWLESELNPFLLLLVYCVVLVVLSWFGGALPTKWNWNHIRMQLAMSFIAGFMLAVALVQLLPHAYGILGDGRTIGLTILGGLLVMFLLIRAFDYHHHHFSDAPQKSLSCAHDHDHTAEAHAAWGGRKNSFAWVGLILGLGLHSVIEAIALAAALRAGEINDAALVQSLGIFLAIALHKPLDAMSIASVMAVSHWPVRERLTVIGLYAVLGPVASVLAYFGFYWLPADTTVALGFALAFSCGTFLCISLSDLLPELQFHSHDRGKLSACLLGGVGLVIVLELLPFLNHNISR